MQCFSLVTINSDLSSQCVVWEIFWGSQYSRKIKTKKTQHQSRQQNKKITTRKSKHILDGQDRDMEGQDTLKLVAAKTTKTKIL